MSTHHVSSFIHHHFAGTAFSTASVIIVIMAVFQAIGLTEAQPSFWAFVIQHEVVFSIMSVGVFVAGATAMAPPGTDGGGFYGWAYRFTHALIPIAEALAEHKLPPLAIPQVVPGVVTQVSRTTEEVSTAQSK